MLTAESARKSLGMGVERKFQTAKVPKTFAPAAKVPGNESSRENYGAFAPGSKSS